MYGSGTRLIGDEVKGTEMTGVEHLGQYVFEMTKAKVEASRSTGQPLAITESKEDLIMGEDDEDDGGEYGNGEKAEPEPEELDEID